MPHTRKLPDASSITDSPAFTAAVLVSALCYVCLLPYPFIKGPEVAGLPLLRLVPLAAGLLLLPTALYLSSKTQNAPLMAFAVTVAVLIAVQLVGSMGSAEPVKSAGKAVFYGVTGLVFFFAAWGAGRYKRQVSWAVVILAGVVGLVSAVEFIHGSVPVISAEYIANNPYYSYPLLKGRSFSTLGHPVFLGAYFALSAPVGFYLIGTSETTRRRTVAAVLLGVALVGLFFTFSRGAYLATIISAVIYYRSSLTGWRLAAIGIALVAVVGVASVGSTRLAGVIAGRNPYNEYVERFGSAHRVRGYEITARVLDEKPLLGLGVGNYRLEYERLKEKTDDNRGTYGTPDNMYLVSISETGIAGTGVLLYLLYMIYSTLKAGIARAYGENRLFILAGVSILAGFMLEMLFFDALYVEPVRIIFWSLMGLCCRAASEVRA